MIHPITYTNRTMVATGFVTFFLALGAMSINIALWLAIYKAYSDLTLVGVRSSLGVAFWLTLVALTALLVAAFP